jgi:hypothetical protein
VRVRALKEGPDFGFGVPLPVPGAAPAARDDTTAVWLEVRAEPKLQIQFIETVAVEKATDDQDQKREKAAREAPTAPAAPGGLPGLAPPGGAAMPLPIGIGGLGGLGGTQFFQVDLKKAEKEAKALKEFAGTITTQVVGPGEPMITVDKITKAAGETVKGKDSGHIKVTEVKEDDGKITLKFELDMPRGVQPATGGGPMAMPGFGPGVAPPLPPPAPRPAGGGGAGLAFQAPPAAPAQVQVPVGGAGAAGVPMFSAPGITLVDDKGKTITQTGGGPPKFQLVPGQPPVFEYTQEYKLEKDQKPAKLVFSGSKAVGLDIPFSFKDVPLK